MRSSGWNAAQIEAKLWEWNKKNPEALSETIIKGQLDYSMRRSEVFPPPNCDNEGYYKDILVCTPDSFCTRFKNPVSYAAARYKNAKMREKGKKKTKKKEAPKKNKKEDKTKKKEPSDTKISKKSIK